MIFMLSAGLPAEEDLYCYEPGVGWEGTRGSAITGSLFAGWPVCLDVFGASQCRASYESRQ